MKQLKYFFIEDEEFPLLMNLRPYSGRNLNKNKKYLNIDYHVHERQ